MRHNSRKEQALIELRVNVSDGIRQADHGGCVVGQARIEGVVIGLVLLDKNKIPCRICCKGLLRFVARWHFRCER